MTMLITGRGISQAIKVFGLFMKKQLVDSCNRNMVISENQHGFINDFSYASDNVDHELLLYKSCRYAVRGLPLQRCDSN
ncbi:unnamed protein product [Acanthoscelides obtectus]|uniref:Uncharacterized protein n=1 Tax=Acanthoscelides obtectus TaxID=200917 RepID=A0A9P0JQE0_ACAOB|nr:unnamed protein product [Acanthoscelides obtectus]CAK1663822.1 hypothetical protein AOBTE_LOCUS23873 [Acanthoscelides obtectus]